VLDYGTQVTKEMEFIEKDKFLSEPATFITHTSASVVSRG
jgi:hypothetical protein